jgi:hypothetical protein
MKSIKFIALTLTLAGVALTSACSGSETCNVCDPQGRSGVTVRLVDADSVVHDFTTGDNGCVSFQASSCSEYQVVDSAIIAPESPPVN